MTKSELAREIAKGIITTGVEGDMVMYHVLPPVIIQALAALNGKEIGQIYC